MTPPSTGIEDIIGRLPDDYGQRVYYVALRKLRSRAAAEDVRNETMVRVIAALRGGQLRTPEALPGFVLGIARNVILEEQRKGARADALGDRDFAFDAEQPLVDHTVRRAIDSTLARLKPREREVLRLTYYEELSRDEISARLGIIPERVRLVKSRALASFREFYGRLTEGRRK